MRLSGRSMHPIFRKWMSICWDAVLKYFSFRSWITILSMNVRSSSGVSSCSRFSVCAGSLGFLLGSRLFSVERFFWICRTNTSVWMLPSVSRRHERFYAGGKLFFVVLPLGSGRSPESIVECIIVIVLEGIAGGFDLRICVAAAPRRPGAVR